MKKILSIFLISILGLLSMMAYADVTPSIEDKQTLNKKNLDFLFKYIIGVKSFPSTCQATRIHKRWFVTAANCVVPTCDKECNLQFVLIEGKVGAFLTVKHTSKNPAVFAYDPKGDFYKNIQGDFALIRADLEHRPFNYFLVDSKRNTNITLHPEQVAMLVKRDSNLADKVIRLRKPNLPRMTRFDKRNYKFNVTPFILFTEGRNVNVRKIPNTIFYPKMFQYAVTTAFNTTHAISESIRAKMGGASVISETGELMGILPGNPDVPRYDGEKQERFFVFLVFNQDVIQFMKKHMGRDFFELRWTDAAPDLATPIKNAALPSVWQAASYNYIKKMLRKPEHF